MDVLVQQSPEYVSLAWGAMKFLFTVSIGGHGIASDCTALLTMS